MLGTIIGGAGTLTALIGWFGFDSIIALIVGSILYLLEDIIHAQYLTPVAKLLDPIAFGIGCLVGIFVPLPWYICGMLGLNIFGAIAFIGGTIMILVSRH